MLFAGIPVTSHTAAVPWYEKLFGGPATFRAHDTESVWELAENRSVYVVESPEHAGHALTTVLVADLDSVVAAVTGRGIRSAREEDYGNGVRKIVYRDPDGNEFGYAQAHA